MEHDTSRSPRQMVRALWVLLGGGMLTLSGLPFPVNGRYWDAADDAQRIVVIDADRGQFAAAFGLSTLGALIVAIGLASLAPALAAAAPGPRRRTASLVATGMGAIGAIGAAVVLLHALLATPEFFVDSVSFDVAVIVGGIAVMLAMIIVGALAWAAPPPKWAAVVLIVGAPLGFVPEVQQVATIVFAVAGLVVTVRTPAPVTPIAPAPAEPQI